MAYRSHILPICLNICKVIVIKLSFLIICDVVNSRIACSNSDAIICSGTAKNTTPANTSVISTIGSNQHKLPLSPEDALNVPPLPYFILKSIPKTHIAEKLHQKPNYDKSNPY